MSKTYEKPYNIEKKKPSNKSIPLSVAASSAIKNSLE